MSSARRGLLILPIAVIGSAVAVKVLAGFAIGRESGTLLAGLFSDTDAAFEVGRAYLERYPHEGAYEKLWHGVFGHSEPDTLAYTLEGYCEVIRVGIENDFRVLDTVLVNGWVLARTEARVCALQFLGASRDS